MARLLVFSGFVPRFQLCDLVCVVFAIATLFTFLYEPVAIAGFDAIAPPHSGVPQTPEALEIWGVGLGHRPVGGFQNLAQIAFRPGFG